MNLERQRIGIIGLGLLGAAINQRLQGAGYDTIGFDIDPAACERFQAEGGISMSSPAAVFAEVETVIFSLPNSDVVGELLSDLSESLNSNQTIIDTTTGDPDQMKGFADELAKRGVRYLESNVAGSSMQLASGEAVLILGGDQESVSANLEILTALSHRQFHMGDAGCGARFKLVHNLVLGLHRAVLAEGLAFSESLGFDPSLTLEVLRQTPAASKTMESKGEKMIQQEYSPQAKLSQHLKDVRLILELAQRKGATTPLSQVHRDLLQKAEILGLGNLDNSSIREVYRDSTESTQS